MACCGAMCCSVLQCLDDELDIGFFACVCVAHMCGMCVRVPAAGALSY